MEVRVVEDDKVSGFKLIGEDIAAGIVSARRPKIIVRIHVANDDIIVEENGEKRR